MALNIGLSIGKQDMDIAAWINMLKRNDLPVTQWVNAIVFAYLANQPIDIGTIQENQPVSKSPSAGILFGSGSSQASSQTKKKRGWNVKGPNGELIEGSIFPLRITNKQVMTALQEMKNHGIGYSSALKLLIRKYLKKGPQECLPPDNSSVYLMQMELLESIRGQVLEALSHAEPQQKTKRKTEKKIELEKVSEKVLEEIPDDPPENKKPPEQKEEEKPQTSKNPLLSLIS